MKLLDWIKCEKLPKHIEEILVNRIKNMSCRVEEPKDYCSRDENRCLYPRQKAYDEGYIRGFIEGLEIDNSSKRLG